MPNVSEIAKLNDAFRVNPSLGTLILTEGKHKQIILINLPQIQY